MGKRGKRVRVMEHVYRDRYGYEIAIKRNDRTFTTRKPLDSSEAALRRAVGDLLDAIDRDPAVTVSGSYARDIERYEALASHLADVTSQRAHLRAAVPRLGRLPRRQIAREDILKLRADWATAGVQPKTINNRLSAMRALWHLLDGDEAPTPLDGLKPLRSHRTPTGPVDAAVIVRVDQGLVRQEQGGKLRSAKTRARFRVLATTGVRPSELMRAQPGDLVMRGQPPIWQVRDGKGGYRPVGIPLVPAAVEAWQLFIEADAWGDFNTGSFAKRLRQAGWPTTVRPYALRHSLGMALSEAGVDLADISLILGHTRIQTTRLHYVGPLWTRMVTAMQTIATRVAWVPAAGAIGTTPVATIPAEKAPAKSSRATAGTGAKVPIKR